MSLRQNKRVVGPSASHSQLSCSRVALLPYSVYDKRSPRDAASKLKLLFGLCLECASKYLAEAVQNCDIARHGLDDFAWSIGHRRATKVRPMTFHKTAQDPFSGRGKRYPVNAAMGSRPSVPGGRPPAGWLDRAFYLCLHVVWDLGDRGWVAESRGSGWTCGAYPDHQRHLASELGWHSARLASW